MANLGDPSKENRPSEGRLPNGCVGIGGGFFCPRHSRREIAENHRFAARLREAGVPVTLTRYEGMIHAFIRRTAIFDHAKVAMARVTDALKEAFA